MVPRQSKNICPFDIKSGRYVIRWHKEEVVHIFYHLKILQVVLNPCYDDVITYQRLKWWSMSESQVPHIKVHLRGEFGRVTTVHFGSFFFFSSPYPFFLFLF